MPKLLTGIVAAAVGLVTASAQASIHTNAVRWIITVQCVGQAGESSVPADKRVETQRLLKAARAAMVAKDWKAAQALISKAERLGVRYSRFYLGDSPQKARRDFKKAVSARSGNQPKAPSKLFSPFGSSRGTEPALDPFLASKKSGDLAERVLSGSKATRQEGRRGVPSRSADLTDRLVAGLDSVEPYTLTSAQFPLPESVSVSAERKQADRLILDSRRSLATGDVQQARAKVAQAKLLRVSYGLQDDSPSKLEADIRRYEDLVELVDAQGQTAELRQRHAKWLMEQAEALVQWKEFDEAERLASDAGRLGVRFGPLEATPEKLLQRIRRQRSTVESPRLPTAVSDPMKEGNGSGLAAQSAAKRKVLALTKQARQKLEQGDIAAAKQFIEQAQQLGLPDSVFVGQDDRPQLVALEIQRKEFRGAAAVTATDGSSGEAFPVKNSLYDSNRDPTRNIPAQNTASDSDFGPPGLFALEAKDPDPLPAENRQQQPLGKYLLEQGEKALADSNMEAASRYFKEANQHYTELSPAEAQRLSEHLQLLTNSPGPKVDQPSGSLLDETAKQNQILLQQVSRDLARQQSQAHRLRDQGKPLEALKLLQQAKQGVEKSTLSAASQKQLLRRVETSLRQTQQFIEQNRGQIELNQRNTEVLADVERERTHRVVIDEKLAKMVNDFNQLIEEHRYAEAEVLAKRAGEIAPNAPIVKQLVLNVQLERRYQQQLDINRRKVAGFNDVMNSVDSSSIPFDDNEPLQFNKKYWEEIAKPRSQQRAEASRRRSKKELIIEQKLSMDVSVNFNETPLGEVIDHLSKVTGVPIVPDPLALQELGIESSTPVTLSLNDTIKLKSALNLILQQLDLIYVIKNDVLNITNKENSRGRLYQFVYPVGDLVIPIPNFVSDGRTGLGSAIAQGIADASVAWTGVGSRGGFGGAGAGIQLASANRNLPNDPLNNSVLGQLGANNGLTGGGNLTPAPSQPFPGAGPAGLGGGSQANFGPLIQLILETIEPDSWVDVGGVGSISQYSQNLSLIINQTEEVHEQIRDLLEQLRRLQDLQVALEVRILILSDDFFERIGLDFDFNISDVVSQAQLDSATQGLAENPPSVTVGLQGSPSGSTTELTRSAAGAITASPFERAIKFRQGSFASAVPQFGGFDPATAATFGFAILSDIDAFFFLQAAQGDSRSNSLNAIKQTLFNGQLASIQDTTQRPFVIGVIPVVGDFAAAQQPIIVVLPEGTQMMVQAVVSPDRRFVRMTLVPAFTQIGDVETFTFEGSTSSTNSNSTTTDDNNNILSSNAQQQQQVVSGTTIQLPEFSQITVSTTVSVPDGGTILLGGFKRLREGRTERGVPILSKIPYINRLFRNSSIGRETQSIMLMVTPRIIIQEEEEEKLGIVPQP